jgi:DNA topoisomerase I
VCRRLRWPRWRTAQRWWRRVGGPGRGFRYLRTRGEPLSSRSALARIEALRIPPGWRDVHIAPSGSSKIQAWGYDQAGRKQYIYSSAHVAQTEDRKWRRVLRVARVLPALREATNADLRATGLGHARVHATVVRLICRSYFRVGSERYAVSNRTFGICTLRKRHVRIEGHDVIFTYKGKRRKDQRQVVAATPLVEIIRSLQALPGERLFRWLDEGGHRRVVPARSVNAYLREILGERITSKDLRTFGGTVRAATILADLGAPRSATEARRNVMLACRLVAHDLGNTAAICRKAYIHPAVLAEYEASGRTIAGSPRRTQRQVEAEEPVGYYPEERALIRFLERYG